MANGDSSRKRRRPPVRPFSEEFMEGIHRNGEEAIARVKQLVAQVEEDNRRRDAGEDVPSRAIDDGAEVRADRRVYQRRPWTPWTIEVVHPDNEEFSFECFFRTTSRDGRECELFTLVYPPADDYCICQVRIWQNGEIEHDSYAPLIFCVNTRKKTIILAIVSHISTDGRKPVVTYDHDLAVRAVNTGSVTG